MIDVGERSGSGLCDIFNTWEENGFVRPEIKELTDPARVVLTLEVASVSNEARNEELTGREIELLEIVETTPEISAVLLSEKIGISRSTIDRTIKSLKEKGYIEHEGSTKKGTWKVLK